MLNKVYFFFIRTQNLAAAARYSALLKSISGVAAASALGVMLYVTVPPSSKLAAQNTTISSSASRSVRQQNILAAMYGFTSQISEFIWSEHATIVLNSFQVNKMSLNISLYSTSSLI